MNVNFNSYAYTPYTIANFESTKIIFIVIIMLNCFQEVIMQACNEYV